MTKDSMGNEARRFCSYCNMEIHEGFNHVCDNVIALSIGVDHDKIIPADERTDSAAYSMALLCKQDKEQLDRVEEKLDQLLCAVETIGKTMGAY